MLVLHQDGLSFAPGIRNFVAEGWSLQLFKFAVSRCSVMPLIEAKLCSVFFFSLSLSLSLCNTAVVALIAVSLCSVLPLVEATLCSAFVFLCNVAAVGRIAVSLSLQYCNGRSSCHFLSASLQRSQ